MKVAKNIAIIGADIQTNDGAAFFTRDFVDMLAAHPKVREAYRIADKTKLSTSYTIYVAEPDGSVTVLGDEVSAIRMTEYTNNHGPVEILGPGPLSERFLRVRMDDVPAYLTDQPAEYLVFADTLRYRMDGQPHDLDVRELKVLSTDTMASEDGSVSLVLEVKG
jgi:hypothetical protein